LESAKLTATQWICRTFESSLGRKYVMALTGAGMSAFLVGHLSGNLLAFLGPDIFNAYAAALKANLPLLWGTRIILLICIVFHLIAAISLSYENRRARGHGYSKFKARQTTLPARHMFFSGGLLLIFIGFHLAQFTLLLIHPEFAEYIDLEGRHDVYRMMVDEFREPLVAYGYVIAMILLAGHLFHGLSSLFQSLGIRDGRLSFVMEKALPALAFILSIGFISLPLSVQLGFLGASL